MEREKIVVVGGSGTIGREVCRLAVALGHDVLSVCLKGAAPNNEPWTSGVEWVRGDITQTGWEPSLKGAFSVVVATEISSSVLLEQANRAGVRQVIEIHQGTAVSASNATTIVTFHDVTTDDVYSDGRVIRIEQLAMALLRCALEYHPGVLSHDEVVHLGDAMMIQ